MRFDPTRLSRSLTAALALVIVALTLSPREVIPDGDFPHIDKLWHALAFAALVLPSAALNPRAIRWVVPVSLSLGLALEVIQPSVGRLTSILDFLADAAGVALGLLFGLALRGLIGRAGRLARPNPR